MQQFLEMPFQRKTHQGLETTSLFLQISPGCFHLSKNLNGNGRNKKKRKDKISQKVVFSLAEVGKKKL